ncbi:MAG TPA: Uma2 family endonuclease [Pseudonocardiaceae bacterium]|nr:Uma2 family endonuclease [Pseudonocardiaceae bacterium]
MTALPWPDHLLTLDEWEALPEETRYRVELVEGVLLVSPRPVIFHQWAVTRLGFLIHEQLPTQLSAASEAEIVIAEGPPPTVRAPDVIVIDTELALTNPPRCQPGQVHLAIEVLSEGSVRTDRVTKFAEYAEVGIERYWIVDLDAPATLTRFHLIDGAYELFGEHAGMVTVDIDDAPITLDLDALTTRRSQKL